MNSMNTAMRTLIIGLLVILSLTSCEDYVDIEIPQQEKKLVAYSFISPQDSLIKVFLGNSFPLFANSSNPEFEMILNNATVRINDGINEITLPFNYQTFSYEYPTEDYPIVAGKTYYLTIEVLGYKTITAQTTVPADTPYFHSADLVLIEQPVGSGFEPENRYVLDLKWYDFAGTTNFYSINIFSVYNEYTNRDAYYHYTDVDVDGSLMIKRAETYTYHFSEVGSTDPSFRVYLLNVNKDYYIYHRSIENISYGDPFSEPTLIYTNIENGLGCFAAFNGSSISVTN